MKKLLAMIMALMLLVGCAMAEEISRDAFRSAAKGGPTPAAESNTEMTATEPLLEDVEEPAATENPVSTEVTVPVEVVKEAPVAAEGSFVLRNAITWANTPAEVTAILSNEGYEVGSYPAEETAVELNIVFAEDVNVSYYEGDMMLLFRDNTLIAIYYDFLMDEEEADELLETLNGIYGEGETNADLLVNTLNTISNSAYDQIVASEILTGRTWHTVEDTSICYAFIDTGFIYKEVMLGYAGEAAQMLVDEILETRAIEEEAAVAAAYAERVFGL